MAELERGFKSWTEQIALSVRREMGLSCSAPLPAVDLARHLDVLVWSPHDVPGLPPEVLDQLLNRDPDGWSAVSCYIGGEALIIYNPRHSTGRMNSDLAHELAHILLEHDPSKIVLSQDGSIAMRSFNDKQEEEANWLGWCLLLPRDALVHIVKSSMQMQIAAAKYCVSEQLLEFRLRMTGVRRQFRRR
jgi:Zn-dependent peptidase ImmA (M78 family)